MTYEDPPEKWEYKLIDPRAEGRPLEGSTDLPFYKREELGMNKLGLQGWELCGIGEFFYFKRRKS
jgi:hypothetical protein